MVRRFFNELRNILLFRVIYPWVRYGRNVHVQTTTRFFSPHRITVLGDDVGIGHNCIIHTDLIIGNCVMLASHVGLIGRDDHTTNQVGLTMFHSPRGDKYRIVIEDDVWIGFGAIVLSGVTIGRGSIVAAGSLVANDVKPYSIVAGVPAIIIKMRFTEEEIARHEKVLYG